MSLVADEDLLSFVISIIKDISLVDFRPQGNLARRDPFARP